LYSSPHKMFVIKLQLQDDIRRVTVENPVSLQELQKLAQSLFADTLPEQFSIKYKDDEGDVITVTNDRELDEAFRIFKEQRILRFILGRTQKPSGKCPFKFNLEDLEKEISINLEDIEKEVSPCIESLMSQLQNAFPKVGEAFCELTTAHRAICDGCNSRIFGVRWKCLECPDYDLCNTCKESGKIHVNHKFDRIERQLPFARSPETPKKEEPKKEEPKKVEPKVEVKKETPKAEEPKKEEPKKVEPKVEVKKETPKEAPKEVPKKEEPKKEEPKKEVSPLESKLIQLEEMGFADRSRNIELLVTRKGDMLHVIRDLLGA